ncbi:acyltransferase [Chitinibacter sp. SCUT-21]|uniref:acyltransferase family protein n=1 Tax=Chitinibacter sp. SCUT-21 TaxID=2970891 RepID=UPI0035A5E9C3
MNQSQRFIVLDSFRGLCAVSVVLFHLHIWQSIGEWRFFRSSGLLVEFFFVLSGFVLAHRYHLRRMTTAGFTDFMISRSCRILPLHFATLCIMTTLIFLRPLLYDGVSLSSLDDRFWHEQMREQWLYNATLLHAWLPDANLFSFNGPAWSISVEYYIYIAFGLIILLAQRRSTQAFCLLIALCSAAMVLLEPKIANSPGLRGLICFFVGAAVYALYLRLRDRTLHRYWMTALEIVCLFALYWMVTLKYPYKSYWATWGFASAILLFAYEGGLISSWLKRGVFTKLGEWSFSIYLVHYLLLYALTIALQHFHPSWLAQVGKVLYIDTGSTVGNNLLLLMVVASVLFCARASYQWIERPGMKLGKFWQQRRSAPAAQCAAIKI